MPVLAPHRVPELQTLEIAEDLTVAEWVCRRPRLHGRRVGQEFSAVLLWPTCSRCSVNTVVIFDAVVRGICTARSYR